jgi:hypothetical protein
VGTGVDMHILHHLLFVCDIRGRWPETSGSTCHPITCMAGEVNIMKVCITNNVTSG